MLPMRRNSAMTELHTGSLDLLRETTELRDRAAEIARSCMDALDAAAFTEFIGSQILRDPPPLMLLHVLSDHMRELSDTLNDDMMRISVPWQVLPALDTLRETSDEAFTASLPDSATLNLLQTCFRELGALCPELSALPPGALRACLIDLCDAMNARLEALRLRARIVAVMEACVNEWLHALEVVAAQTHISAFNREHFVQNVWHYRL
jgi:hypothetical protein